MILKRSMSIEVEKRLNERFKKSIECRRTDELWRKKLCKIETSTAKILFEESRKNSFFEDEYSALKKNLEDEVLNEENTIEIHSITVASFNILFRQKNVEIFVVFMKDLKI
jgi:hypothetical protein